MSVGIGLGLLFLMLEGLSLATLRQMPADRPRRRGCAARGGPCARSQHRLASKASLGSRSRGRSGRGAGQRCRRATWSPTAVRGRSTSTTPSPAESGAEASARWLSLPGERGGRVGRRDRLGRMTESDVFERSSRALGELINEVLDTAPSELIVFLGGTATVDGGAGMLEARRASRADAGRLRRPRAVAGCRLGLRRAEGRDAGAAARARATVARPPGARALSRPRGRRSGRRPGRGTRALADSWKGRRSSSI